MKQLLLGSFLSITLMTAQAFDMHAYREATKAAVECGNAWFKSLSKACRHHDEYMARLQRQTSAYAGYAGMMQGFNAAQGIQQSIRQDDAARQYRSSIFEGVRNSRESLRR